MGNRAGGDHRRPRMRAKALFEQLMNKVDKVREREENPDDTPMTRKAKRVIETFPNRSELRSKGIAVTRHTGQGWQGARLGTRARKRPASLYTTIAIVMMRNGKKTKILVPRDSYVPMVQP